MLVQRLCGICPVSHHLCAAKAMDGIVGVDKLTPTAEKMRRLMHYGQMFQSHALHFFHLASPDLLFGFDAPVAKRNVIGVIAEHPELARPGRADAQVRPGDHQGDGRQEDPRHRRHPRRHQQEPLARGARRAARDLAADARLGRKAVAIARDYTLAQPRGARPASAPSTRTTSRSCAPTARWTSTTASCARSTPRGRGSSTRSTRGTTSTYIAEEVRPWSYMKFPFIRQLGAGERLVPGRAAGARQHLRLHRHAGGRGRAPGVHGRHAAASRTTSRWPTTGRA